MHKQGLRNFITFLFITVLCGCASAQDPGYQSTLEFYRTRIPALETQIADLEEANWNQWEAISYLSTQMPYALDLITPIPPGITITPTAYDSPEDDPSPTPTPWMDLEYPPDFRTGFSEIDVVIDAVLSGDLDARMALVKTTISTCSTEEGLGGPPRCVDGEVDGTLVEAFPVAYTEGVQVRPEDIHHVLDFTVQGLVAVARVPANAYQADYWPAGEFGVVFSSEDGGFYHLITVLVADGAIVRLDFYPGEPPFDEFWSRYETYILPPLLGRFQFPLVVCTPPACGEGEVYHCPDACPGGCGTTCATATP